MSTRVTRQQHTTCVQSTGLCCWSGSRRCTICRWSQLKERQSTPLQDYTKQGGDHQVDSGYLWVPLPAAIGWGLACCLQLPDFSVRRRTRKKKKPKQNNFWKLVVMLHRKIPVIPKSDVTKCDMFFVGDSSKSHSRPFMEKVVSIQLNIFPFIYPATQFTFNLKVLTMSFSI